MSPSRVSRRLRREVRTHPRKTAILALLCVVALWFWVPLVWSWIDKDDRATEAPAAQRVTVLAPAPSAAPPPDSDSTSRLPDDQTHPWHLLAQWMNDDPRTSATNPLLGRRDPFLVPQADAATTQTADELRELLPNPTPEDLGMVLSGTIIGPHRRVAQINGRSYRQGRTVRLLNDGEPIEFTLAVVHPRRVVLKRNGEQFELTIPVPDRSDRIELSRAED